MRLERAAPGRPVVAAARGMELHGIPLQRERLGERRIVRVVLLVECAGDRGRHGTLGLVPRSGSNESFDPSEAGEAGLLRVGAPAEVAAGLEEEAGERPRLDPVRVEEGEAAEARPDPDPSPAAAAGDLVEPADERAGVGGRRGEGLDAVGGLDERDAAGRGGPVGDEPAQEPQQAGPPRVVPAVEDDEERPGARADALEVGSGSPQARFLPDPPGHVPSGIGRNLPISL